MGSIWKGEFWNSQRTQVSNVGVPFTITDIVLLFVLPTIAMVWLFASNYPETRTPFEYAPLDPSVFTLYANNFAHSSLYHISVNMSVFWLVGGATFALLCACGKKWMYYLTFGLFLVAYPVMSEPLLHSATLHHQPTRYAEIDGVGFSGILTALVSFLAVAIALYIRDHIQPQIAPTYLSILLVTSGALTAAIVKSWHEYFILSASLATILSVGYIGYALYTGYNTTPNSLYHIGVVCLSLVLFTVWAHRLLAMKGNGMGFNIHLAGYIAGFLIALSIAIGPIIWQSITRLLNGVKP